MDYTGKSLEVVDFGGEVDYSGHQWFQEPPPRPEVKNHLLPLRTWLTLFQPQPVTEPYIPDNDVINQNEAFDFALKAAPNVLYGRFKQYGQVCAPRHDLSQTDPHNSSAFSPGAPSFRK